MAECAGRGLCMHRSTADQPFEPEEDILPDAPCPPARREIGRGLTLVLAVACGLTVANLYYNQPLLAEMATSFGVSPAAVGMIPMLTQIGYAVGLLLIVPLGDLVDRRKLVTALLGLVTIALCATAMSPRLAWLAAASFAVGVTTVVPQVLIPLAAQLSAPERRGKTVGTIMSGLLTGILLSRTVSGILGHHLGWSAVFWMGAGLMLVVAFGLRAALPKTEAVPHLSYPALMRSLWTILKGHPVLRHAAVNGSMMFACFSAFWVTLAFCLAGPPFHYGAQVAGLFGLVGAAGALIAPLAGRAADRVGPRSIITAAAALMAVSFVVLWLFGSSLIGLVVGTLLLDVAATAGLISNQTRIYSLPHEIHSRVNTVYMVSYFTGGAAGSFAGAAAWNLHGWAGVCGVGAVVSTLALIVHLVTLKYDYE